MMAKRRNVSDGSALQPDQQHGDNIYDGSGPFDGKRLAAHERLPA